MSLKRIELQGFKSFAKRTVISFDKGFNCIVGPNGCGKSNVADAIRWVLGEQSAKTLRGDNMQDVIFKGTATLPQMSYAEVSLYFDNTNGTFDTSYDEVVITRKLFRSGASEYYLNHNMHRLKDIITLMRDTGAGREGYSIIGQGKVSEIMNSKPIGRRKVFEEATGISRIKAEKIDNERKLERTKIDIRRVADILSEIEGRLIPLRKQVEAAKKYETYKEQLKYQELNHFLYQSDNSKLQKAQRIERKEELCEAILDKEAELEVLKQKNANYLKEDEELDRKIRSNLDEREALKVAAETASGQVALYKAKKESLDSDSKRLVSENAKFEKEIEDIAKEESEARIIRDIKINDKITYGLRLEEGIAQHNAIVKDIEGHESDIEATNYAIISELGRLTDAKTDYAKAVTEENALKDRIAALDEEITIARNTVFKEENNIATSKSNLEKLEREKSLIRERRNANAMRFNENQCKLREFKGKLIQTNTAISVREERIATLSDVANRYNNYQDAVRAVMQDAATDRSLDSCIIGVVGQLIDAPQEFALAIEVVLGASIQNIVTYDEDGAKTIISHVQRNQYGRVTCLPFDKINARYLGYEYKNALSESGVYGIASELVKYDKAHENIVVSLLGRTVIVKDMDIAKALANRYDYGFKIVTLDGTIFDPRRTITGGSFRRKSSIYLSQEGELKEQTQALETLIKEKEKLEQEIQDGEERAKKIETNMNEDREAIQGIDVENAAEIQRIATSEERVKEARECLGKYGNEKSIIVVRLDNLSSQIKSVEFSASDIEVKKKDAGERIELSKTETESKKKTRDALKDTITELKIVTSNLDAEIIRIEGDIKKFGEIIVAKSREQEGIRYQLQALEEDIKKHSANEPKLEYNEEDSRRIEEINAVIKDYDKRREEVKAKIVELDKEKTYTTNAIKLMSESRTREEGHLERIDSELELLRERIFNEYGLEYEQALEYKDEEFNHKTSSVEINSLRGKINQLGNINFNAIEDYEAESVRHTEFEMQVKDLTKAEKELEELLGRISKEMSERFLAGFEEISKNFKKTFVDLFGGGKAELVLEKNEEDEFERGVEILVQLPGKAMQPLAAISGGEQALTSIAILFAILRLRPMPFAVLDEVETALDDSNARRFALYLKKYSRDTKFIVISHKKPSMEQADILLGVTMEEPGVSQIITAAFEEAVKMSEVS